MKNNRKTPDFETGVDVLREYRRRFRLIFGENEAKCICFEQLPTCELQVYRLLEAHAAKTPVLFDTESEQTCEKLVLLEERRSLASSCVYRLYCERMPAISAHGTVCYTVQISDGERACAVFHALTCHEKVAHRVYEFLAERDPEIYAIKDALAEIQEAFLSEIWCFGSLLR